jgi:hypothetical protein
MKCDDCKYLKGESASMDYPYPVEYCGQCHWDGDPAPLRIGNVGLWDDCKDFDPIVTTNEL